MSFVTVIRDYVETLNTISESTENTLTFSIFFSESVLYIFKTLQSFFLYIVTFRWLRDFSLLPIILPQLSQSILKEIFFLETPSKVFFEFLEIPTLNQNKFLLGFFNSFFLSLPLSIVHVLSIRRLLIQGIPAGVYSIGGYVIGQLLFITCTIFGLREVLIPWIQLEPLNYFLGVVLIFRIIYSMTTERSLTQKPGWFLPEYKTYFLTSFLLAWCEQSSMSQYLGNLTISPDVSLLESFSSNSSVGSFFSHFSYIFGILVGSLIFISLWGAFFLQVKNWFILNTPLFLSSFIQFINKISFVIGIALSLSSIPFYGFDYLLTSPFGFVSQDNVFKKTIFEQRNEQIEASDPRLSDLETNFKYLQFEVSPFDRGQYLTSFDVAQPLSFEDLNYRGEFDWTGRNNKQGIADSRGSFFALSKIFKKSPKPQIETRTSSGVDSDFDVKSNRNELITSSQNPLLFETSANEPDFDGKQRFFEWYDQSETIDRNSTEFFRPYTEFSKTSFPSDYLRTASGLEKDIEEKFKAKYYSNPLYKTLLTIDIDLFLNRQPQEFELNAEQEQDLYTKRRILQCYLDSLKNYSQLPYSEFFDEFFEGAKSFSNKVYNQQFKGTLRSVRRLFSLTLDSELETTQALQTILKFDQPLYQLEENPGFSTYHEELVNQPTQSPLEQTSHFVMKPFYAGWDTNTRKFVITNKFLPRTLAGYKVNLDDDVLENFSGILSNQKGQKIKFTTWPLSSKTIFNPKTELASAYSTLYITKNPTLSETDTELFGENFSSLPANYEIYKRQQQNQQDRFQNLAPKRGGFLWPGTSALNTFFGSSLE